MKLRIATYLLVAAFFIGSITPTFSQSPEQLFQKGLVKEEGEGALNEAIDIYIKIVDNHDADKSLQAKALLHVGQCYEKLGRNEATKAYQRLVKNFPGQKNEVAIARKRLSRLILAIEEIAKTPLTPKFTKIKIPTKLSWNVALSPDGEDLALVSDNKLWRMPLSGNLGSGIPGTPVQLKTDSIKVEWTGLSWSRNGKWIAFNENPIKDKKDQSIYIVSSIGGTPKKIIENNRDVRTVNYRISLSPDGKKLAFTSVEDKKQYIQTISVNGEIPQQLAEMQAREPAFSPDGKMIAFVEDKNTGTGSGDLGLWVVPASGGTPQLVANADMASSPVWSPDGKMIAYLDNSDGKKINIVPVSSNAITSGKVTSIDVPEGIEGIIVLAGWTPANEIGALIRTKVERGLYTLPAKGGQAAIVLYEENPVQPRWSPDSKKIYYTQEDKIGSWTSKTLAVVSTKGGKGKILTTQKDGSLNIPYQYQAGNRVSPDGKMIISAASSKEMVSNKYPSTQIWKIPVDGGTPTQITNPNPLYADFSPSWSPNGNKVAFLRVPLNVFSGKDTNETSLYVIKSTGGDPELLIKDYKYMWSSVWSPDGKMIAYHTYNKKDNVSAINVVNVIDGVSQIVTEITKSHVHIELAWSPDSKQIAFNDKKGKVIKIMTLADGSVQDIETNLVDVTIYHLDWSPDGERFVFAGMMGGTKEFWFMADFLPLDKLAQKKEANITPPQLINIKVWNEDQTDVFGEISPDGKYLSFIDWDTGDLAIYHVETGNKRNITNKGTWEESNEYTGNCKWFSDSKKLAYAWYNKDNYTELRTIDINNPKPEIVLKDKRNEWMEVYDCSPDGNKALACLWKTGDTTQIVLISIIDGSVEILKSTEDLEPNEMTFTPDGRNIVFDLQTKNKDDNGDIYMMNLFSKAETVLVEYPGDDQLLGWVPSTNSILFVSDRAGSPDIWKIEVDKSKPVGKPELIQNIKGPFVPHDLGFTKEGVFYYGKMTSKIDVFEAELDPSTGQVIKKAEKSIKKYVGLNGTPNYSNDGNFIAYVSKRSSGTMKFTTNHIGNVLCIKSLITGEETELRPNIKLFGWPRWSSDDKSVMVVSLDKGYSYYQIDTQTGNTKPLFLTQARNLYGGHHLSKDYKTIFYGIRDSLTEEYKLVERDIKKQTEKVLYKSDGKIGISMSPNEKHLAIVSDLEKCIKLIPVDGGEIKELLNSEVLNKFDLATWGVQIAWSHDNKHIYFVIGESKDEKRQLELCRTSVEKGTFERTGLISFKQFANLSIHPDGRRITFSARGESNSEVWALENFLPNEETDNKHK